MVYPLGKYSLIFTYLNYLGYSHTRLVYTKRKVINTLHEKRAMINMAFFMSRPHIGSVKGTQLLVLAPDPERCRTLWVKLEPFFSSLKRFSSWLPSNVPLPLMIFHIERLHAVCLQDKKMVDELQVCQQLYQLIKQSLVSEHVLVHQLYRV